MSAYKLTGMHSHRHPFLGDPVTEALAAAETQATEKAAAPLWSKLARPAVSSGVTGVVTYATCRAFSVAPKQARQVAFVIAGLNLLVGLASDWIYSEMEQLAQDGAPVTEAQT
jgi:hypothetical protein